MKQTKIKEEEVTSYTVAEFIETTRPDGKGYILLDGEPIAAFEEVICDSCNAEITQPEAEPRKPVVHVMANMAWCAECLARWAAE
jgi:uncharacterized protein with PIN domain